MIPSVGYSYISTANAFLKKNGVEAGAEFAITNTSGNKISLTMTFAHGRHVPSKITIAKSFFGQSFEEKKGFLPPNSGYAVDKHYFPEVDDQTPTFHSLMGLAKRGS
jgi:hypothetical protein